MAEYSGNTLDTSSEVTSLRGCAITGDGSSIYALDLISASVVYVQKYDLSTPGDLSSATYDTSIDISSLIDNILRYIFFSDDGSRLYTIDVNFPTWKIREASLSTPYDISTYSYNSEYTLSEVSGSGIVGVGATALSGSKLYVFSQADEVIEYNFATPYSISTLSFVQRQTIGINGRIDAFNVSSDGLRGFAFDRVSDDLIAWKFQTSGNISSIIKEQTSNLSPDVTNSSSSDLWVSGNQLYIPLISNSLIYQINDLYEITPVTPPAGTISEKASGDNYVTLTWMNSLGGWEYWTFTSRHSYGDDVQDLGIIERDIFQDWDSGFINGQSEREVLGKDVTPFTVLRSQALTKEQVDVIKNIRSAIKVQVVTDSGFTTVIVDAGSFTYRTDREKNILIEFTIRYPRTQIQKL